MFTLNDAKAVYVYPGPTDMRYGISGLSAMAADGNEKTVHVFCSSDRRTVKVLMADEGCVYLLQKRLTVGTFTWPEKGETSRIDIVQLMQILDGMMVVRRIEEGGKIRQRKIV